MRFAGMERLRERKSQESVEIEVQQDESLLTQVR